MEKISHRRGKIFAKHTHAYSHVHVSMQTHMQIKKKKKERKGRELPFPPWPGSYLSLHFLICSQTSLLDVSRTTPQSPPRQSPTSGPLLWLFPLPGMPLPLLVATWLIYSLLSGLCPLSHWGQPWASYFTQQQFCPPISWSLPPASFFHSTDLFLQR